jgi:D-glycero-alpha-D-manno-heptose-7-phosphate kinase
MVLISRTPLRVSLFGGGTDYPEYFRENRGAVIGLAINKYIYIACLKLSGIQGYSFRLAYSQVEHADSVKSIQHPAVRVAFEHYGIASALDLSVMADMPASSGLGSSSTFSVGLINVISKLKGESLTKLDLALRAIHLEQCLLEENVGVQDQLHAAFGGFNRFDFSADRYRITPTLLKAECLDYLMRSMVLVHTGIARHASKVVATQVALTKTGALSARLSRMLEFVDEAERVLSLPDPVVVVAELGRMLREAWSLKRSLTEAVSSPEIDRLHDVALANGALGGKLCGAGGGGFLLMLVPPDRQEALTKAVSPAKVINLGLDTEGSTIIYS